jgi:hypothetical protein
MFLPPHPDFPPFSHRTHSAPVLPSDPPSVLPDTPVQPCCYSLQLCCFTCSPLQLCSTANVCNSAPLSPSGALLPLLSHASLLLLLPFCKYAVLCISVVPMLFSAFSAIYYRCSPQQLCCPCYSLRPAAPTLSVNWTSFYVVYSGGCKCNSLWPASLRSSHTADGA